MCNISKERREKFISFLETLKSEMKDNEENIKIINLLENELYEKKYGLVFEEHSEKVDEMLKDNIPVFSEDKDKCLYLSKEKKLNFLIEGDNLHCLYLLQKTHKNRIDVIYIDPPYNTGSGDFKYNDKFINNDDGYRHSKRLSFMKKRLIIARSLLSSRGAIFISIDDNEQANLKLLCDEIFGENNFLANLIVTAAPAGTQSSVDFAQQHAYCLCYRKSEKFHASYIKLTDDELNKKYSYGLDEGGNYYVERLWKRGQGGRKEDVPSLFFPVYFDQDSKKIYIDDEIKKLDKSYVDKLIEVIPYQTKNVLGRRTWSKEKMIKDRKYLTVIKVAGEWKLHKKVYKDMDKGKKPYSIIGSDIGRTELGSLELKEILGEKKFAYPKFSGFIKYLLKSSTYKNSIILDFFAGSGTTGQAVMELNKEDGGNRTFILCTNNENNISTDVCYPRLKTVITGLRTDNSKYSDGISENLSYLKTDFVSKKEDDLSETLLEHVKEMIELENGDKIDNFTNVMITSDEQLDNFIKDKDSNKNIKKIYLLSDLFDDELKKTYPNVSIYRIPDNYFNFELREVGEIW